MMLSEFSFGPFSFDDRTEVLLRNGTPIPLGRRGARLLGVLLRKRGNVATKAELMSAAWPDATVEEANLSVQISLLRRCLDEARNGGEWIKTISRVGYRLVVPSGYGGGRDASVPTLAVLAFQNLSGNPEQSYYAEGIFNDVVVALSRFREFTTVPYDPLSNEKFADVLKFAREDGMDYALAGGVRRDGERVRVTARLLDGQTGRCLWGEKFDGPTIGLFDVQDQITERVASLVDPTILEERITMARRKPPDALDAYDLHLRAMPLLLAGSEENLAAIALLERSIALAPDFPEALAVCACL